MVKKRLLSGLCVAMLAFNMLTVHVAADEPGGPFGQEIGIDVEKSKVVLAPGSSETIEIGRAHV